jgi:soluble lytic murein transglycosylase-like protein
MVLVASLVELALIVHTHRNFWFGQSRDGAAHVDLGLMDGQAGQDIAAVSLAEDSRYRALSEFVAKRYRISQDMAYNLVELSYSVGHQHGLDPLLIIAVIAIESRFNPIAESLSGAKGLMQIIPKYHTDKLEEYGGEKAVFDPVANIKVGSQILKDYLRLTGNLGIALQMYAGELGDGDDQYTTKVMNEQRRLKQVLSPAPSRPVFTKTSSAGVSPAASDLLTSQ